MDQIEKKKLLIHIAQMYYNQNMTQNQIAKETGINRSSISRLLKKMRDEGLVKIIINYDVDDETIEQKLNNRFGLTDSIVVSLPANQSTEVKLAAIGQACAKLLDRAVKDNDVIGFSWGSSLASTVDALEPTFSRENIFCVPMVGGPSGKLDSQYHVNTISYEAAQKFRGRSLMIDVPAIVEKPSMKRDILGTQYFKEIAKMWDQITVAVFGVGSLGITGNSTWQAFYGDSIIEQLKAACAVGDICSRFFNTEGKSVHIPLSDRTITIPLEKLKKTRYSIGVAESREKVPGIIGALKGGYMNVLVTTDETAKMILEETG
ncbi:sugar-binding transcriptional regulator [Sporolactobacillus sp. THM7-7]|nr:sugar-binding transcriptional regulator [Sporolactobacillus sp. THM7-7]